ncbi:glycosyltransferase family 2 protein [Gloeobacter kilaueensis]|uniref:Glycosyl transferase family protein n=1 Tax=Gloeobacter kilaueensis (strain ATCC BAA-2537 / CCAP 1431/1 / ULC 316 / JS1) TaxID=1183438 RepID=U5QKK5_GLOK1|nr:glycosyltransferase family 2 protein [Gloeobacter kilaueensis]AGY59512.1 glycosyl transferase family protein [Gloeobacter kilaueensis JS1]
MPSVAVCIPTYNQAAYLEGAVQSAYGQNWQGLEVWLSDDASTDTTPALVSRLEQQYPDLRAFRQERNLGMSGNPRWILRQPRTTYIAKLDSDDLLAADYLPVLVELLQKHPEAGYAHAAVQQIDEEGRVTRIRRLARPTGFQSAEESLQALVSGYRVAANICLFRREALVSVDYLKLDMDFCDDWDLAVRLADAGWGNVYSSQILAAYRVWDTAQQVRFRRKADELGGMIRVFEESLIPAFKRRGWDVAPLTRQRIQLALLHATVLDAPAFSTAEREQIVALLRELGESAELTRRLVLMGLGLGPLLRTHNRAWLWSKDRLKQLLALRQS